MGALAKLKSMDQDSVEVSGLAKSLSGVAGEVFASLGSKARAMLDGFVKSKQMTEDEVALGLRSMATDALFGRYMTERPRDDEDKEWEAKGKLVSQAFDRKTDRMNQAMTAMREGEKAAYAAFDSDQDQDAFQSAMAPVSEQFRKEMEDIQREERETVGGDPAEVGAAVANHFLGKAVNGFKKLSFGDNGDGILELGDKKGTSAVERLNELGFSRKFFGNGLAEFTANFDIPGIGRGKAAIPNPDAEPSAAQEEEAAAAAAAPKAAADGTAGTAPVSEEEAAAAVQKAAEARAQAAAVKQTISVLTAAVIPPEARSFSMVTDEARKSLDASYSAMSKAGVTNNFRNGRPEDVENFLAGFDRRSLYAIASDSEGKFTKTEQEAARTVMTRQQAEAMAKADPTGANPAAGQRAAIAFLDAASAEEKTSDLWSAQRAAARQGVDEAETGRTAVNGVTGKSDALLRMMKGAVSVTV